MPDATSSDTREEIARLSKEAFGRHIRPTPHPEDNGKYYAVDVLSGDFEINEDDYNAVTTLRARRPSAKVWLGMVGQPMAYKMGMRGFGVRWNV